MKDKIRLLIVDDSNFVREILKEIFSTTEDIEVVGEAVNGREAIQKNKELNPDIITMDIEMPECNGLEATEVIMAENPKPILILSSVINKTDIYSAFNAIKKGALDAMEKPNVGDEENYINISNELIKKIRILYKIPVIRHIHGHFKHHSREIVTNTKDFAEKKLSSLKVSIVAIGASTGGPQVLREILKELPSNMKFPIVIVQHMSVGFLQGMVDWLNNETKIKIKIAENNERLEPGVVYFAPDEYYTLVKYPGIINLTKDLPKWTEHIPCVNYLFKSVAEQFGAEGVGILLTGMGKDGAEGMKLMKMAKACTIAQDEASSLIFGMPKAAIELNAVDKILNIREIIEFIKSLNS